MKHKDGGQSFWDGGRGRLTINYLCDPERIYDDGTAWKARENLACYVDKVLEDVTCPDCLKIMKGNK